MTDIRMRYITFIIFAMNKLVCRAVVEMYSLVHGCMCVRALDYSGICDPWAL